MSPDRARERVSQNEPKNEKIALQANPAVYPALCNGWLLFLMIGYIKRPITFELL